MRKIASSILAAALLAQGASCAVAAGYESLESRPIAGCFKLHGMPGPEDMALNRATKTLYVSSHNRRNFEENGKLFSIDLSKPDAKLRPSALSITYPPNFKPHGMSRVEEASKERLYVISHAGLEGAPHTIEVFERTGETFAHIKTIKDPALENPNDLQALSDGRIFVSNDHGLGGKFRHLVDDLLRLKRSRVSYFDGTNWSLIGPPLSLGNGILYQKESDKEYIYRSGFSDASVIKYEIIKTPENKTDLKEVSRFEIGNGPDNLELDEQGRMLAAAHPSVFKFLRHVSSPANFSPTQIVRINLNKGTMEEIYANHGEEISAASTALTFNKHLILSQVFEDFLLVCPFE